FYFARIGQVSGVVQYPAVGEQRRQLGIDGGQVRVLGRQLRRGQVVDTGLQHRYGRIDFGSSRKGVVTVGKAVEVSLNRRVARIQVFDILHQRRHGQTLGNVARR